MDHFYRKIEIFPTVDLLRTSPHSAVYILVPGSSDGYQGCMLDIFLYVYIKYIFSSYYRCPINSSLGTMLGSIVKRLEDITEVVIWLQLAVNTSNFFSIVRQYVDFRSKLKQKQASLLHIA